MKQFILWASFIIVPTLILWHYNWPYIPIVQTGWHNIPYSIALLWAMWYMYEKRGWFSGRPSDSDAPHMHVHPQQNHF